MAELLSGKPIALKIKEELRRELARIPGKPKLVAVQIGKDKTSDLYLSKQKKEAMLLGIDHDVLTLSPSVSQEEAIRAIKGLNEDAGVTSIILEMPVPKIIDAKSLICAIDPIKDAECMHPANIGRILFGDEAIGPCTPMAVMELIKSSGADLYGKEAVCIGHSDIVGKPLALMLLNKFATTSICHIATAERGMLKDYVNKAEVLVVAVGKPALIKGSWIKKGAIVVDVGINKEGDKIVGDVEFEEASKRASFITPVPGGVGPLTTAMLMKNIVYLFKRQREKQ